MGGSTHCQAMHTCLTAQILCNEARCVSSAHIVPYAGKKIKLRVDSESLKKELRCIGESIFFSHPYFSSISHIKTDIIFQIYDEVSLAFCLGKLAIKTIKIHLVVKNHCTMAQNCEVSSEKKSIVIFFFFANVN